MNTMKKLSGALLAYLVYAGSALAQTVNNVGGLPRGNGVAVTIPNPLNCSNFGCVAGKITNGLFILSIPIVAIMVLYGGFQIMTAGGSEEKYTTGRKTILYAAIGFVVVLLADSVADIIKSLF